MGRSTRAGRSSLSLAAAASCLSLVWNQGKLLASESLLKPPDPCWMEAGLFQLATCKKLLAAILSDRVRGRKNPGVVGIPKEVSNGCFIAQKNKVVFV